MAPKSKIVDNIPAFVKATNRKLDRNLFAAALFFQGQLIRGLGKGNTPKIETGRLRGSMATAKIRDRVYWVGSSIQPRAGQGRSYPFYQELGFTHWKSKKKIQHPWLRPIFAQNKIAIVKIASRKVTS